MASACSSQHMALALLVACTACGRSPGASPSPDAGTDEGGGIDAGVDANPIDSGPELDAGPFTIDPDQPTIPVGLDAYRRWDAWPQIRLGMRAYMRSTYDRAGGNEWADASHFLRLTSDRAIPLDVTGPGVVMFQRFNHWHGSPWTYSIDGHDSVIQETDTTTAASDPNATFLPQDELPPPLAWTFPATGGADLIGVPMGFTRSLTLGYGHTHYGTGYFIYDLFPEGAKNLSRPIEAWTPKPLASEDGAQEVIDLLNHAGQDIAPTTAASGVDKKTGSVAVPASSAVTVLDATGPAMVRALRFTVPIADADAFSKATLRATWDGRAAASIDAPLGLFFGTGSVRNTNSREYIVKALPVNIHFETSTMTFAVYFPMPFFKSAHIELVGQGTAVANVTWEARTQAYSGPTNWMAYFHATYTDHGTPVPGHDLVMLDTTTAEGGGNWCGQFVGSTYIFTDRAAYGTLEGDPRFFFDDSQTPQVQGTGSEEWGGGGDYWNNGTLTTTLPFYGHPVTVDDPIQSAYRFLLADLMPFGKNARIQLEHGGADDSTEHYRTVAYWYGLPNACLLQTDTLHVGDTADEAAHRYVSPDASPVDVLTSRYELGVDHVGSTEVYPESTDTGRHTTGTSEFSLAIAQRNFGVLLRRKLDYGYSDQRAEVYVADDTDGATFVHAGTWYLAGSNQCVGSIPPGELDPFAPAVQTSNRRWRDDEFLLPRALTDGRSKIRVRFVYVKSDQPLTPSVAAPASAWSEFRYWAYSYELP